MSERRAEGAEGAERAEGRRIPLAAMIGGWLVTAVLFYAVLGSYLGRLVEGVDPALMSSLPLVVAGVAFLASVALTVAWARGPRAGTPGAAPVAGRRGFLLGFGGIAGGVAASGVAAFARLSGWATTTSPSVQVSTPVGADVPRPEWKGATVQRYRPLGRTGFAVSDVSLGSTRIRGEEGEKVARLAIDRGVNYFDTAPDYAETGSETALGKAMQGRRDRMFVATKFCTPQGHLPAGSSVEDYMAAVEGSLQRLRTDYVDLVHVHACDRVERLLDPNVHEAFDRLKEQGKARFLGFSSHTPNLEGVARAAIDSGRFDVMMPAYHFGGWPSLPGLIDEAAAAGMGVVAMKTLKGAYHRGLLEDRDDRDSYTQAAFKWVLSNPAVGCLVISFRELANVDEYLYASGRSLGADDVALLERYDDAVRGRHCLPHCGACLGSCPAQVPIHDVLRHRMYFEAYGDEKEAMRGYAKLGAPAAACATCAAPCQGACPVGISIPDATRGAHELLTLS